MTATFSNSKQKRSSNIELLRIILMIMIIFHHIIVHGFELKSLYFTPSISEGETEILLFANSFIIMAVNTFILISAYFGIRFRLKTLISFILQGVFYSVLIYSIFCAFNHQKWSLIEFYQSLIPILSGKWWFLSGYIMLLILAPVLNAGLDSLSKHQFRLIIIAMLILSNADYITLYNPDSFINKSTIGLFLLLYVIGRYIKKYSINIPKPLVLYLISASLIFITTYLAYTNGKYRISWSFFQYTNPLIIVAAIGLLGIFQNMEIKFSRIINALAPLTFGVYLLHDAIPTREVFARLVKYINLLDLPKGYTFITILALGFMTFFICATIEKIRQILFQRVEEAIMRVPIIKKINDSTLGE